MYAYAYRTVIPVVRKVDLVLVCMGTPSNEVILGHKRPA